MENKIQGIWRSTRHEEFGELEVLMIDDKPYFPATECAKILGYANPKAAVIRHCRGVTKRDLPSASGIQSYNFIPEGDLYRLIVRSKLPTAERFEIFVFDEVLPAIRKHGGYITDELLEKLTEKEEEASRFLTALVNERNERNAAERKCESLRTENAELKDKCGILEDCIGSLLPSASYCDTILQCEDAVPITVIASSYGVSAVVFNRLLQEIGIQRKIGGTWILYSRYNNNGYTVMRSYPISENKSVRHCYWTERGRKFIYDVLKQHGILPEIERNLVL